MTPGWFQNGTATDSIAINDRGLQYGDGLFETIAVRDGSPRLWPLHAERLQSSCQRLGIDAPVNEELLQRATDAIVASDSAASDALLKIIITRGTGQRGYRAPAGVASTVLIGMFERSTCPVRNYQSGITIRYCHARLSIQPQTAGMKLLSRLDQVRARSEWQDAEVAEGLMLDNDGQVVCGTMSNLFIIQDSALITPQITQCGVSGVMRRHILAIADKHGLDYQVTGVTRESMATADEIFLCNSQFGIWPVAQCGKKTIADWPLTQQMMQLLRESGVREGPG